MVTKPVATVRDRGVSDGGGKRAHATEDPSARREATSGGTEGDLFGASEGRWLLSGQN